MFACSSPMQSIFERRVNIHFSAFVKKYYFCFIMIVLTERDVTFENQADFLIKFHLYNRPLKLLFFLQTFDNMMIFFLIDPMGKMHNSMISMVKKIHALGQRINSDSRNI